MEKRNMIEKYHQVKLPSGTLISVTVSTLMNVLNCSRATAYRYLRAPDSLPAPLARLLDYELGGRLPVHGYHYDADHLYGPDGVRVKWHDLAYVDIQLSRLAALEACAEALREQLTECRAALIAAREELEMLRSIA